jgi:1-acyl-sn-glycerol-3-phosphate acyltransferase
MPLEYDVPPISELTLRFFVRIVRGYFRRHFRSVMAQHAERLAATSGPTIVYMNHCSWWDPMTCVLLAQTMMPGRKHYAPMDAEALTRYPILRRIGIFPVEMTTTRGAAQFLRQGQAILREGGVLWVTPQGRFADTRVWPLGFKPGLAALALRVPEATLVPLAIEYTFWDERLPEALLHVGGTVTLDDDATTEIATRQMETSLGAAMLALQTASIARDAHAFQVLLRGSRGTGGFYVLGRRLRAILTGRKVRLDHTLRGDF